MKPSEKISQLRGEMSRPEFAKKFNVAAHKIKDIEGEKQAIPDDLALALEKEYGIPFKWWKTGEGPMTLEKSTEPIKPKIIEIDPHEIDKIIIKYKEY